MISLNTNLSALNTANTLSGHYGRLQTSTQRLSSGLRINGASDDAAGLAIRELMRADIAALNQGARNANDAISMLQTFDGALGVIDEKLIRMKELAEQAATGTYDSTQRLMIDSEFQAMGAEIDRIANATDFNGVKLLCTPMVTKYRDVDKFEVTNPGTIENMTLSGGQTANVTKNINAGNLINAANPARTISVTLTAEKTTVTDAGNLVSRVITEDQTGKRTEYTLDSNEFKVAYVDAMSMTPGAVSNPVFSYKKDADGNGNPAWSMTDDNHPGTHPNNGYTVFDPNPGETTLVGTGRNPTSTLELDLNDGNGNDIDFSTFAADHPDIVSMKIDTKAGTYSIEREVVIVDPAKNNTAEYSVTYNANHNTVTVNLKNRGGSVTLKLDNPLDATATTGDTIFFDITLEGETNTVQEPYKVPDPDQKVKIHFGTMNDSAEDYYYIDFENCTLEGLGIDGLDVKTQDNAQNALVDIDGAIVQKDKVRAKYGALQNRLENTVTSLQIQSENLQAAESRISDTDIAQEMTQFVRNQILTQSAVAMLTQANSLPQMVMRLIG